MTRAMLTIALTLAPLTATAGGPLGDVFCDDRARIVEKLESRFGATLAGRGLRGPDAFIEFWVTQASGDWTMVQNYTDGRACIVAMGESWESFGPVDPA
ncbi:hypothetical protein [Oceanicola sp. 502str15]|uniref:hypothetical protein n=1 Tax=Oceanicola sp. 502str15 TaxID=2696061 RepID=UPI0020940760|nr:hypothetical protein [Oceanicola sp. 502str15]MCO6383426.1 hypothetical protein [Oceanicola sp. 502str15]